MRNTFTVLPAGARGALVLALCLGLPGCATIGAAVGAGTTATQLPEPDRQLGPNSFVRLVPSEAGAAPNAAHGIEPAALRLSLQSLRSGTGQAVFLPDQLDQLVAPLSLALRGAAAGQDVAFAAATVPPGLRLTSSQTVTSGRMFVTDGTLNLVVGMLQSPFDLERLSRLPSKVFTTGSRLQRPAAALEAAGGAWRQVQPGRGDWLALPLDSIGAAPVAATAAAPAQQGRGDIESRLATLARLRQQALVNEAEFQEKRRAILNDL